MIDNYAWPLKLYSRVLQLSHLEYKAGGRDLEASKTYPAGFGFEARSGDDGLGVLALCWRSPIAAYSSLSHSLSHLSLPLTLHSTKRILLGAL